MTSVTNPAYSFGFVSADSLRQASAERNVDDALANSIRQAAADSSLVTGTTITARYQFKVGQDGSLVPLSTQITTAAPDAGEEEVGQGTRRGGRNNQRFSNFTDLQKPKATLNPTEESAIFALSAQSFAQSPILKTQYSLSPIVSVASAAVEDESGTTVDAEIFAPVPEEAKITNNSAPYAPRAQSAVAGLYARNSSVGYSIEPLSHIAA